MIEYPNEANISNDIKSGSSGKESSMNQLQGMAFYHYFKTTITLPSIPVSK